MKEAGRRTEEYKQKGSMELLSDPGFPTKLRMDPVKGWLWECSSQRTYLPFECITTLFHFIITLVQ